MAAAVAGMLRGGLLPQAGKEWRSSSRRVLLPLSSPHLPSSTTDSSHNL
ncbi:MRPL10 isoform 4 [Pongo abelii]|uniref:MRPL10 isoform 2 n=1 Tax=Pongo abelii TaxID=9601 RepID=A0A2J8W9I2_PONAB|nr:MRPL10 isoform 2 [Pongo abelii]PNJ66431.1 MRPL10 isoform 4 [Pongo abelii]